MLFHLLVPGTGNFHCGSCLRDHALGRALRRRGHEVVIVPLYLPLITEDREDRKTPVHMGGINMYLQQKLPLLGRLPAWVHDRLDAPGLLRRMSSLAGMTEPAGLGPMTLSLLAGEHGRQSAELDRLVGWMRDHERPDVVTLSNVLLAGMARRIREEVDAPIVCTLQGEAPFLDALPDAHRRRAWSIVAERAGDLDALVAVSRDYGELMRDRLGLEPERLHVVYNGIELDGLAPPPRRPSRPTIGYLARLCPDKGLHTLVEAFCLLRGDDRVPDARLAIAGTLVRQDRRYVRGLERRLRDAGLQDDVTIQPNVDREAKHRFLEGLSVLSVPATYGESFGLYVLEALAAGVPVVQPRHGAFPEIIEATQGGVLCEPDDPASLADALEPLLLDDEHAAAIGVRGHAAVLERFTADRMAHEFERVCTMVAPEC